MPSEAPNALLLAECYDDIRRIARRLIARDGVADILQATELANDTIIRLIGIDRMQINGAGHMLAMAARTMRRVIIDEVRRSGASKRQAPAAVTRWPDAPYADALDIEDLNRALEQLELVSPDHVEVVKLRFMLGLTVQEAALASGVPERTIKRRWQAARAWLLNYLDAQ